MSKICKLRLYAAAFVALLMILPGCKPTERNYKAAYDAAVAKRQAEAEDPDLNLPAQGMHRIGDPQRRTIGGKEVLYLFQRMNPLEEGDTLKAYNVAVAVYKMPSNCRSQTSDLREAGLPAVAARATEERFYVVASSFDTAEEAASFASDYKSRHKDGVYVGLSGEPVVIRIR